MYEATGLSQRRACRLAGLSLTTAYHQDFAAQKPAGLARFRVGLDIIKPILYTLHILL